MNRLNFYILSLLLFGLSSCKKNDIQTTNYPFHFNATINKINYTTNSVSTFGLTNDPGCIANKSFDLTNIGQISVVAFFIDCYFKHFSFNTDFALTKPGSHRIFDGGDLLKSNQCNGDLIIGLVDNSIPNLYNTTILVTTNIINKITNISKIDSTNTTITYSISGNFSCSFKNANNIIIPVTGDFVIPIKEIK
jgi:hypothetical protein